MECGTWRVRSCVMSRQFTQAEADDLLHSWIVHLRSERKSPDTVKIYSAGLQAFLTWCAQHDRPVALDRGTVEEFTADLLEGGRAAATAKSRQLSVRRWSTWLAEEDEIDVDELLNLKPPKLDQPPVVPLSDAQLGALLATCDRKTFLGRRDEAIIRLFLETTARAEELLGMTVSGTQVRAGVTVIMRGKGGKGRVVPFSDTAAAALDRYLRVRRAHRLAGTDRLWLGDRGHEFKYSGLLRMVRVRGESAGISGLHPHLFRHTSATRWLSKGGSQDGLMAVAGWSTPQMLHRYVKATQEERAAEEARRLNLGDL